MHVTRPPRTGKTFLSLLAVMAGCCMAGCAWPRTSSPALDQTFQLALAQRVTIDKAGLTLVFKAVKEDSRCPRDAQCIRAGQATVTIDVSKPGAAPQSLTLTLPKPATANYAGYTVSLVALEPRPVARGRKQAAKHVATLVVRKE